MESSRRSILSGAGAVAALGFMPPEAQGREGARPKPCRERAAYAGGELHPQLFQDVLDTAASVAARRSRPIISDPLDDAFDKVLARDKPRVMAAAVALPDGGVWNQLRGPRGEAPPARLAWPGLESMLVATAVLQAADEGKLSLEDRLDRWAPKAKGARLIRVDDLLSHTSGLAGPAGDLATTPFARAVEAAVAAPRAFCPGGGRAPSEVDGALLARLIEELDGAPLADTLKRRVIDRLGLEEANIGPGNALSASAPDVLKLWRGLLSNRLHGAHTTRARFFRLYPVAGQPADFVGQGVMLTDLIRADPTQSDFWLGSGAAASGGSAYVGYSVKRRAFAAVAVDGASSARAAVSSLLRTTPEVKARA